MSIELYLSIAGIVIIVVTIVTGLEIRKISKEINEIDIENNPKIKFTTKGGIEKLKKRVAREKKEKNNKKERYKWQKILISTEQTVSQFLKGLKP